MATFAWVDKNRCIACGACIELVPEILQPDFEDGFAEVIYGGDGNKGNTAIPDNFIESLNEAVNGCPGEAIKVSGQAFYQK